MRRGGKDDTSGGDTGGENEEGENGEGDDGVSIDAETGDGWRPTRGRGGEGG